MMMSRGIIASVVGAIVLFTSAACSLQNNESASGAATSSSNAAVTTEVELVVDDDEIVRCAISPVYRGGIYWALVTGNSTGGPCGRGVVVSQAEFEALGLTQLCEIPLPSGGTVAYFTDGTTAGGRLAQEACAG